MSDNTLYNMWWTSWDGDWIKCPFCEKGFKPETRENGIIIVYPEKCPNCGETVIRTMKGYNG